MSQLVFLQKIRDLDIEHSEAAEVVDHLKLQQARFGIDIPTAHNPAKQLAHELYQKNVIIVASEHLVGSAYIFKNQINESAKQFSTMFEIPELNHHLLEGLAHPKDLSLQSAFFFLESHRYHPRIRARYPITRNIISDQEFGTPTYKPESNSKLTEAVEVVAFTSYVALYLSLLNTVDPGPNPWVDRLKSELSQLT
jgi:glucose/mannose-6-phosphate isomerase